MLPVAQYLLACGIGHVITPHALSGLHVVLQLQLFWHIWKPHAPVPVQLSVHLPVPQVRLPHAGAPLLHVTSHALAFVHVMSPHAFEPLHVSVQLAVPEHARLPQAALPLQVESQLPAEHVILPHALPVSDVVQWIEQPAPEHEIAPHELSRMHVMSQDGVAHAITPEHCAVSLQLIAQ